MISAPATGGEYMAEQQITPGTKLQVAFDVPMGQKTDFNMLATYKENLDEAYFLMSAPKGSLYRNVCGLQFRYADDMERELVKEYVGYIRAKYKL